ncbi:unnamed protein product [Prunus armeniaca]|uniref:Uncharacterized protein n=1 Tax=Prunus armeniaca TaxID=36596 RepID=A0A6J5WMC4_PRUAR|nr:unnamed protein product [Prunus armeniaca]
MASKTLIRTGASLMNRILSKPMLHPNPNSNHQIVSHGLEITPSYSHLFQTSTTPSVCPKTTPNR